MPIYNTRVLKRMIYIKKKKKKPYQRLTVLMSSSRCLE